jgi:hypothetical protein
MASVVEICNNALNQLGASTILSLTEDSKNARLCNARYESIRNAVFRSHTWNCLIARQELAADTTTPAWGWANQFTLPSDCLRVITISDYDYDYKIEGRKIMANVTPIKLQYIKLVTDPNEYDTLLAETISAALAADIAFAVTANATLVTTMKEIYQEKLAEAKHVDATEGQNTDPNMGQVDVILSDEFINSRF